jgi:uncharacterized protein (DUF1778 family)
MGVQMASERQDKRELRWNFRVAPDDDALVRAASRSAEVSFTDFVRTAALHEAERVLADRTSFALNEVDWKRFVELLDRPISIPPGLRELYAKPSVFE